MSDWLEGQDHNADNRYDKANENNVEGNIDRNDDRNNMDMSSGDSSSYEAENRGNNENTEKMHEDEFKTSSDSPMLDKLPDKNVAYENGITPDDNTTRNDSEERTANQARTSQTREDRQTENVDYRLAPEYGAYAPQEQKEYGVSYHKSSPLSQPSQPYRNDSNASSVKNYGFSNGDDSRNPYGSSGVDGNNNDYRGGYGESSPYANRSGNEDRPPRKNTFHNPYDEVNAENPYQSQGARNNFDRENADRENTRDDRNINGSMNSGVKQTRPIFVDNSQPHGAPQNSFNGIDPQKNRRDDNNGRNYRRSPREDYEQKLAQLESRMRAKSLKYGFFSALITGFLLMGIILYGLQSGYIQVDGTVTQPTSTTIPTETNHKGTVKIEGSGAPNWQNVVKAVSGGVVSIQTTTANGISKGSGLVIDKAGYVVTNNHVIDGAKSITVTTIDGQLSSARIIGVDKTTDLAVIKLDKVSPVVRVPQFANSDDLAVGQPVMAIGNPLGYDDTATAGIVSALDRPVAVTDKESQTQIVTNAVQIDASINPGNSGGPTFDASGHVIGINSSIVSTARESSQAGSIGIGFAIPSNLVKRIANEIVKNGSAQHVILGATITNDTVQFGGLSRSGAKIVQSADGPSVLPNTPAQRAGLKRGDVIIAFNKHAVTSSYSLLGFVRAAGLDDSAVLTIVRNDHVLDVKVTFDVKESAVHMQKQNIDRNNNGNNGNNGDNNDNQRRNKDDDDDGLFDPFGLW